MSRKGVTLREAVEDWVRSFNAIPTGMIERLVEAYPDSWREITTPSVGDNVYVYDLPDDTDTLKHSGEVIRVDEDEIYWVKLCDGTEISVSECDFEVIQDNIIPMWSTMWSFGDGADEYWLDTMGGIREMSACGFRVYKSDEFGYFFGIDGAGYSFYDKHWEPLYRARGLQWHDPDTEKRKI